MIALSLLILSKFVIVIPLQYLINFFHFGFYISSEFDELRPLVCQDSPREQLQQKLNLKYFLFTMEDMSTHSGNKLTEEQIEQLIKRLRGVEHIEPIVTIEDSNVNNEKNGDVRRGS